MRKIIQNINNNSGLFSANVIIHCMAIAHTLTIITSTYFGLKDAILLSILTIAMIFILCSHHKLPLYITAYIALSCCFFGKFIGSYASEQLSSSIQNANLYITLIITEIIGWITYFIVTITHTRYNNKTSVKKTDLWHLYLNSIIIATIILLIRLGYMEYYSLLQNKYNLTFTSYFDKFSEDGITIITLLLSSLIAILRSSSQSRIKNILYLLSHITVSSFAVSLMLFRNEIVTMHFSTYKGEIFFSFIIIFLFNVLIISTSRLVVYIRESKLALAKETKNKQQAEYRYIRFKKQLDPHFLFNSLNMLNNLVYEGTQDQASEYIGKLAGIYRYLLLLEDKITVWLEDELRFIEQYISLLNIRFGEALTTKITIDESYLQRKIVACSLQLLIENAAKHNIVSLTKPLHINIYIEEDMIVVENNLQLKLAQEQSPTKFGLSSLQEQFISISDKEIKVIVTDKHFFVKLPLI